MGVTADSVGDARTDGPQRPSILVVGSRDVGKRSLVRRLVRGAKSAQALIPGGVITSHRWSIDTKYYTADVNLWVSHAEDLSEDPEKSRALAGGCDALVLVFDLSEAASFTSVQAWASSHDLAAFDVLLCVANKTDLIPDHHAHEALQHQRPLQWEQRHHLVETEDSSGVKAPSLGIGASPKPLDERRQEYSEWCLDNGVEYIETCALDEHFDQRISVDGDMQGIARVRSALHAHMWPGMVMKPKTGVKPPRTLSSGDESDFSIEYELLEDDAAGRGVLQEGVGGLLETKQGDDRVEVVPGKVEERALVGGGDGREVKNGSNDGEGARTQKVEIGIEGSQGGVRKERTDREGQEASGHSGEAKRGDAGRTATGAGPSPERHAGKADGLNTNERQADAKPLGKEGHRETSEGATGSTSLSNRLGQRPEDPTRSEGLDGLCDGLPKGPNRDGPPVGGSEGLDGDGPLVLDEATAMREVEHEGGPSEYAEMERMMQEMASVRDRLSGLPDVARREEAARYAMRLMQMFGGDDSDVEADLRTS